MDETLHSVMVVSVTTLRLLEIGSCQGGIRYYKMKRFVTECNTMASLHRKITLAFWVSASLMAILAILALGDLLFLEQRIEQGLVVNNLESTIQDMRRYEKNWFLYQDTTAATETLHLVNQALALLEQEADNLKQSSEPLQLAQLLQILKQYQSLIQHYQIQTPVNNTLEATIRTQGHQATEIIEQLAQQEHQTLQRALKHAKWVQIIGVAVLAILFIGLGQRVARSVVQPMKRLMDDLIPIAEGRFARLHLQSRNAEMVALRQAFNRMLDELEHRRKRLVQAEKLAALGTLIAGVTHELNNPLANIYSSSQLLLEEWENEKRTTLREWVVIIESETERARRIVDALRDFGQRRQAVKQAVPIAELVNNTLILLAGELRKHETVVNTDLAPDLQVLAETQRLQQALLNVLRNAAESGKRVNITLTATACSRIPLTIPVDALVMGEIKPFQPRVYLVIRDNGQGIAPEQLPHVLEPFYTTRDPGQGMGLGLYLVQEIMQEQGGLLAISSQLGQGTQVILGLACEVNA